MLFFKEEESAAGSGQVVKNPGPERKIDSAILD